MSKANQFFVNIKKNMPAHTRWILLGIAIVLAIMIILLLTDNKSNGASENAAANDGKEFSVGISPLSVDFGTIAVGAEKSEKITVSATAPAVISDITLSSAVMGLSLTQTCKGMGQITENLPCYITLTWKPREVLTDGKNVVNIKYYDANGSKDMEKLITANITFAAAEEKKPAAETAAPIAESEDDPFMEANRAEEEMFSAPEPSPEPEKPAPNPESKVPVIDAALPEPVADDYVQAPEECYQFSFAGYNNSGKQIGWIKPSGGHYMFHPFSDKDCSKPTGEYNQKTGFITDLADPFKKIGSDAEHIGGRGARMNLAMPTLSNPAAPKKINRAAQLETAAPAEGASAQVLTAKKPVSSLLPSSFGKQATVSSTPYDRTFVLRHFKPIPATIVNEVRAVEGNFLLPVQATVDRHVYSDNGRTIVVPAGTLMLGSVKGDMPGPYKTIGRIEIEWYRFIRPDGVEFNFTGEKPFSGDSQGRVGVPGYGSSDYLEQMVMPLLTAIVPAATNLIAPISDKIVNQIDLDNNVVVQTGTMRSSEMAKQQMIQSWNKVTEKLFIDMLDNTKPPFSIAAGTRITVYSPTDLIVAWCDGDGECTPTPPETEAYAMAEKQIITVGRSEPETVKGQVASYISGDYDKIEDARLQQLMKGFQDYQSKSLAASNTYYDQVNNAGGIIKQDGSGVIQKASEEYNKDVLGMQYMKDANGNDTPYLLNPVEKMEKITTMTAESTGLTCEGGTLPDTDGCCPGETFTDMGEEGWNCCPDGGGDCFPPIVQ